ncbi:hypothetical protein BGZ76_001254 [Entomortierella beljakovae]|nr:hypothetical protein BGZ76_001254 [Entomortierella beljakovae]
MTDGDLQDYTDLTLPLDPDVIFEASPADLEGILYVKTQHELLDTAIQSWIDSVRECRSGAAREVDGNMLEELMSAKLFYRHATNLYEESITSYHSIPGKKNMSSGGEICKTARELFDRKKELCKTIYALTWMLNHAIAFKEQLIIEKARIFINTLYSWRSSGNMDIGNLNAVFKKPRSEVHRFREDMFPTLKFPHDSFKTHFAKLCHSLMLPVSLGDLESLDPIAPTPGRKSGYLFHKYKNGEWSREYFYIQPNGMLMQWSRGKTLLRVVKDDRRDFVFEICSIEVYLMEAILQATTKAEFEEWKAALFYWHPSDEEIPQIDKLKISTPPSKPALPRPRHLSSGRAPEHFLSATKPRISAEFPVVITGELFMLDLRSKPLSAQMQYNQGETEKPFETIPLADTLRTHIWALDSSLFSKKHCFSIKTMNDVNYYTVSKKRSSSDQEKFNRWLYILKSYAKPEVFGVSEILEYRFYRTFRITVNDCRRLPKDLEAYCEIMLDDQRRARTSTRVKASKNSDVEAPFWRDSFEFTDLSAFTKGITINVIQAKGSKVIPYGRAQIPVRNSDESDESWYPILQTNNRTKSSEYQGDLRLKLKYEEQIVLPLHNYYELLDIIVNFRENNVISRLAGLVQDLEGFARNILRILEGRGLAIVWLNSLIDEEIAEADPTRVNTLFRGNTLLTKALDAYMRLVGTEYLDDTLGDILRNICVNKIACEVDPSKLEKNDDAYTKAQWKALMHHTRTCWRAVIESVDQFPKELLQVFSHLQQCLTERFASSADSDIVNQARYTGVSGFVFLRLICPAILGPRLFHIVKDHPEPHAHRTLTLIAKSLQGLANLVNFGTKEEWMVPMNEFISLSETSSGTDSGSNSAQSLPLQTPSSPGSSSSSIFKMQIKNGNSSSSSNHFGAPTMAPLPSPTTQSRSNPRSQIKDKDTVPLPYGTIDSEIIQRNQDMPILPHLIDLGKELAFFTKFVERVLKASPHLYEDLLYESNPGSDSEAAEHHPRTFINSEHDDEDILRRVARAYIFLDNTIRERVELSVDYEEQERASNGRVILGTEGIQLIRGKMSREASRDGEESIVVYEQYDCQESFDGYTGSYDSDDDGGSKDPQSRSIQSII